MAKLAVITSRFPYPLEKGDKLRIFYQLRSLSRAHEVHLIALHHKQPAKKDQEVLLQFCKSVNVFILPPYKRVWNLFRAVFNKMPFQVSYFYSPVLRKKIHACIHSMKPDAVYCHLIRVSEYVKDIDGLPRTLDYMDTFSKGMERRAKVSDIFSRLIIRNEYRRLLEYEKNIFDNFDKKVIISERDRQEIPHPEKESIHIVPNGVDFEEFYPGESDKRYDLLFMGNMGYPPNIEAALFAATKILPGVHRMNPKVNLLIAGIDPPARIRALKSDRIEVIDYFEHIRDAFSMSRILVAPMFISIGLQNKIIQSMAMKVPCIASSLANLAIQALPGKAIIVADSPADFAREIINLLEHPGKREELATNAYNFVKERFDWEIHNRRLEQIIFSP